MSTGSLSSSLEPGGRPLMDTFTSPSHPALSCPLYEGRVLRSPQATGIGFYSSTYTKGQGYYNTCSGDAPALCSTVSFNLVIQFVVINQQKHDTSIGSS